MRKLALLAAALCAASALRPAHAEEVVGPYISLGAGYDLLQTQFLHTDPAISGIPSGRSFDVNGNRGNNTRFRFGDGFNGAGAIGYGLGGGLRIELEGNYRYNEIDKRSGSPVPGSSSGHGESYGAMGNVLYDLDLEHYGIPTFGLTPYIGAGAGYNWRRLSPITTVNADNTLDRIGGTGGGIAYQGIVGLAMSLPQTLPGLALTVEYRYFGLMEDTAYSGTHYQPYGINKGNVNLSDQSNHSVMLGLRYALFQPPPPPPPAVAPAPQPAPPPAVEAPRTYLVFFDWDRADLSARAREIVGQAAAASTKVQTTRIEVNGYTDLSGTASYNQGLSVRRARAVEAELIRDGVPANEIAIHGYGESNPLVPTAKGVREPQNRRVEIILK